MAEDIEERRAFRRAMLDRCFATTCAEAGLERLNQPRDDAGRQEQAQRLEFLGRMQRLFGPKDLPAGE